MPIVGTAGHVDHGKSTLVLALTGRDPDRWAEEKDRGLTIDLGFAWATIEGIDVGFVDVPGHERFIKNMLAGVGAIDCALLVVAADSGWMPQTEEHASVLDLLDISHGVIALTRIDLVDEDTVEIATLEIMEEIEGTVLEGWPIVPVSAVSGAGLDSLTSAIALTLRGIEDHGDGPFKMWIDRAFNVSGAGAVVTGTISRGTVAAGDEIEILPGGSIDHVRGLHHHDQPVDRSSYGSRTAINLQSSRLASVARGNLVCAPGSIGTTTRLLAVVRPARTFEEIPQRGAFHLHIGSAHSPAAIRRQFGTDTYLITLDAELPMVMGDRFILRDSGRQAVVGGGRVIDPTAAETTTAENIGRLVATLGGSTTDMADALISVREFATLADISVSTGGGQPSGGLIAGEFVVSQDAAADIANRCRTAVEMYHDHYPLRPGMPKPELATQIGVDASVIDAIVATTETLDQTDGFVRLKNFLDTITRSQTKEWDSVRKDLESSFDVPRMSGIALESELLHALIRRGDLIQISTDLVFTRDQVGDIQKRLHNLSDEFSVSEFKENFGMTRRQAVPMLEWLDTHGWTKRSGDTRIVRSRPK